jgi:DNA polymerase III epsilon subunit-like protein
MKVKRFEHFKPFQRFKQFKRFKPFKQFHRHRALDDARLTAMIWMEMVKND